jgi:hypothetical protein
MAMQTTLYHASVPGGPTGLSFQIGATWIFAPTFEERLYLIAQDAVQRTSPVAPAMAEFLIDTLIEPRLAQLRRCA